MNTLDQQFVIRTKNGFFYHHTEGHHLMVCAMASNARHFPSRMAALQTCATSPDFAGAYIVAYIVEAEEQDAPPSPQ